jgi:hypothetical protein
MIMALQIVTIAVDESTLRVYDQRDPTQSLRSHHQPQTG